jgi:hypothetical protein
VWCVLVARLLGSPLAAGPLPWHVAADHPTDHGYQAVCEPMRCCGAKTPHASWLGPWHEDRDSAEQDADEHNRQFPSHGARVKALK